MEKEILFEEDFDLPGGSGGVEGGGERVKILSFKSSS